MLHLYLLILQESNQVGPNNRDIGWWGSPCDLMPQASVIIPFQVHVEWLNTFCYYKLESHLIENWHGNPLKVNPKSSWWLAPRCAQPFGVFFTCTLTCFLGVLGGGLWSTWPCAHRIWLIKLLQSLYCIVVPKFKPSYLLYLVLSKVPDLQFKVLCMSCLVGEKENILVRHKMDTSVNIAESNRRQKPKL